MAVKYGFLSNNQLHINRRMKKNAVAIRLHNWGNLFSFQTRADIQVLMGSAKRDKKIGFR